MRCVRGRVLCVSRILLNKRHYSSLPIVSGVGCKKPPRYALDRGHYGVSQAAEAACRVRSGLRTAEGVARPQ